MTTIRFPLLGGRTWEADLDSEADSPASRIDVSAVTVEALAHGLSLVNRFSGATRAGYSVAEHSVILHDWVRACGIRARSMLVACLLHDATEAMGFADSHGALKKALAPRVRAFEKQVVFALWRHLFGGWSAEYGRVLANTLDVLKVYDTRLGNFEAQAFGFPHGDDLPPSAEPLPHVPQMLSPDAARLKFLLRWRGVA